MRGRGKHTEEGTQSKLAKALGTELILKLAQGSDYSLNFKHMKVKKENKGDHTLN